MEKTDIERIRSLPIEAVAERLGFRVSHHKCLCPFHADKHPSLTFSKAKNSFTCYACSAHGSVIDLTMKALDKNFLEACQWLANGNNVILTERQPAEKPQRTTAPDLEWLNSLVCRPRLNAEAEHFLFEQRKLSPKVVQWLGISSISSPMPCWRYGRPFFDAPSLLIPYRDVDGRLVSVQSRYLGADAEKPRFRFVKGAQCSIFNLPVLKLLSPGEPLFIAEGVSDCMALLSAGHKAIAIPSATLLTPRDRQILASLSTQGAPLNLHMYPDADAPGEKLYRQLLALANEIGASLLRHQLPEGCKDFADLYRTKRKNFNT